MVWLCLYYVWVVYDLYAFFAAELYDTTWNGIIMLLSPISKILFHGSVTMLSAYIYLSKHFQFSRKISYCHLCQVHLIFLHRQKKPFLPDHHSPFVDNFNLYCARLEHEAHAGKCRFFVWWVHCCFHWRDFFCLPCEKKKRGGGGVLRHDYQIMLCKDIYMKNLSLL